MFSYFENQYRDMAFAPNKGRYARSQAALLAEDVLAAFLQGQEKAALFHEGAALPVCLIEDALSATEEDSRHGLVAGAMKMIWRQVRSEAPETDDAAG